MKNIVIISSSLRTKSSSRILASEVLKGASENNKAMLLDIKSINLKFCIGCLSCQETGKCVIKDDVAEVIDTINNADILVFATPIYYYSISGQLKTFLDRLNPLYVSKSRKFKKVYAIFTCADGDVSAIQGPKKAIQGWVDCFEGVSFEDSFSGLNINCESEINKQLLDKAYEFGKKL